MNRPCPTAIICPGPTPGLDFDSPVTNYSSEYNDGPEFRGLEWPIFNPFDPGDPGWWSAVACAGLWECISFISQEDADACARRLADLCAMTPPRLPTNSPEDCLRDPSSCVDGPTVYYNTAQTCQARCPDGSYFYWTIPSGWFVASSQGLADKLAGQLACQLANQNRVCLGALNSQPCVGSHWDGVVSASGVGPFTFAVISGLLPTGIVLVQTGPNTFKFTGTTTTAGHYSVLVRAVSANGWAVTRLYTISALGILNSTPLEDATVGEPYSVQLLADGGTAPYTFTLENGSLPDGLTLSESGLISGTPTTEGTADFTIRVSDSTP